MIRETAKKIRQREKKIAQWFAGKAEGLTLPVTASVDLRNAGFKLTVVDTNVFPGGFNNLCNTFSKRAALHFKNYFAQHAPGAKKIRIFPEAFTRNRPYLEHLERLQGILAEAGFAVTDENPDVILLNNDCSSGIPEALQKTKVPIFPSPKLGWFARRKKHHIEIYCSLLHEFAALLDTDGWRFCPVTCLEHHVDIQNPGDLKRLQQTAEKVAEKTAALYKQYGIGEKPYVFIKSNAGTFGLGQIHVEDPSELLNLNRKTRKKLAASKGGAGVNEFLIQEGVPTLDTFEGAPIEPVIYYVGGEPVGGFFRIHQDKNNRASLNAPGARFETLCFHKDSEAAGKEINLHCDDHDDFFTIAKWLGKIACLAVAMEEKTL